MYKRAVYFFPGSPTEAPLTLYSAYYGDLASIAERFFKMRAYVDPEGYGRAFLKANTEVDFAPQTSLQTDYRTVLDAQGTLSVWSYDSTEPPGVFKGAWYTFVNQYVREPLYRFQMEAENTESKIMTVQEAEQHIRYLREFWQGSTEIIERFQKAFFLEHQLRRIEETK
jgi:hypothetical protein